MATALPRRRFGILTSLLTSLVLAGLTVVGFAGTAHAEDGYTYWGYHHLTDGAWEFATTGPADFTPEDGSVEGYRYGTSTQSTPITPRADLSQVTFDEICADEEAGAGEKRVGVLIDYGVESDAADGETPPAPRGACAVLAEDANGQQVLDAVADVRIDQMLCGIDGYPVQSCSLTVKDAQVADEENVAFELPAAADTDAASSDTGDQGATDNGLLWPLLGVGLVVVLIAAGALAVNRRNKTAA